VYFLLLPTANARVGKDFRTTFLPQFYSDECRNMMGIRVEVSIAQNSVEDTVYFPGDTKGRAQIIPFTILPQRHNSIAV
jgi:hypothetical protein